MSQGALTGTRGPLGRIGRLLIAPRSEWRAIAAEPATVGQIYRHHVAIVFAVPALVTFLKLSILGEQISAHEGSPRIAMGSGILRASIEYGASLGALQLTAYGVAMVARRFLGFGDLVQAVKTVGYAWSSVAVGALASLLTDSVVVGFVCMAFTICMLYLGLIYCMRSSPGWALLYTWAAFGGGAWLTLAASTAALWIYQVLASTAWPGE